MSRMARPGRLSPSYRITIRLAIVNRPGMLGRITSAIGRAGGDIGAVDLVEASPERVVRDLSVNAADEGHAGRIAAAVRRIGGVKVMHVSDRTFLLHLGGKIEVVSRNPIKTRDDLSMVYTPGVGRVSSAIGAEPEKAWSLTIKRNTVAIVTDGSAILGLGNLGPLAALPVMEGKAAIFKEFAGIDAFPLCLATQDADEIVETVKRVAPVFGAINLEDISSPRCFEIEERLVAELDLPVMHDDQHGTAIVVLAGLINALKLVRRRFAGLRVVVAGAGAAGRAVSAMLLAAGVRDLTVYDRAGAIWRGRPVHMNASSTWLAARTNPRRVTGPIGGALKGSHVFIGLSGPGVVAPRDLKRMARNAIVFALANPVPEVRPEDLPRNVTVTATGRSDYPNQINNALAFPGVFRGALDVRARSITEPMKLAAARALAATVAPAELDRDYIVPSVFNPKVVPALAAAVRAAARRGGIARRSGG